MKPTHYLVAVVTAAALTVTAGVTLRSTAISAHGTPAPAAAATAIAWGGVITNAQVRKDAAYTVANADKGATIALVGDAFYAASFNAASEYDEDFAVIVSNADAGRAKAVALPGAGHTLWPLQSALVFRAGGEWRTVRPERWKLPAAPITIHTDFDRGDDANDGLAPGPGGAMRTVQAALGRIQDEFDFNGTAARRTLTVRMADDANDTAGVHFASHGFVGGQGGAAVVVEGGTNSTLSKVGDSAFHVYFGTVIQLKNVTLESDRSGLDASHGAMVYFGDVRFGACGAAHIQAFSGARVEAIGPWRVDGPARYGVVVGDGATFHTAFAPAFARDVEFTAFVLAARSASATFTAPSIPLGGHTVRGQRYLTLQNGVLSTGNGREDYFPGDRPGSASSGGIYQ